MRLRILGCHGGESPNHHATSFLIDGKLLLDAGSLTRSLSVQDQCKIDHVFISHSHLDHIRDLALLADNVIGVRKKPVRVYCTDTTAHALERHLFNNIIWPDFTKIENAADPEGRPVIEICRIASGATVKVGPYEIRTVRVNHPVECHAMFVSWKGGGKGGGTFVYSGDTGPTDDLWYQINKLTNLRGFIFEVSFPNKMEDIAKISGHLTPKMLATELQKFKPRTKGQIWLYHLKPGYQSMLEKQIKALGDKRLLVLKPGDEFTL